MDTFIDLLRQFEIAAIADVRSSPYSHGVPYFNQELLAEQLERVGIRYVFLGAELGARRSERECYEEGIARYELIAKSPLFERGLDRVRLGSEKHRIALMCAEKDPIMCHRSILICRHLKGDVPRIRHILEDGNLEAHEELEERLLDRAGLAEPDLFTTDEERLERAYDWQGDRIEYQLGRLRSRREPHPPLHHRLYQEEGRAEWHFHPFCKCGKSL